MISILGCLVSGLCIQSGPLRVSVIPAPLVHDLFVDSTPEWNDQKHHELHSAASGASVEENAIPCQIYSQFSERKWPGCVSSTCLVCPFLLQFRAELVAEAVLGSWVYHNHTLQLLQIDWSDVIGVFGTAMGNVCSLMTSSSSSWQGGSSWYSVFAHISTLWCDSAERRFIPQRFLIPGSVGPNDVSSSDSGCCRLTKYLKLGKRHTKMICRLQRVLLVKRCWTDILVVEK